MVKNKKCIKCKAAFPPDSLISYNGLNYCPSCYEKRIEDQKFYDFICEFFTLEAPGPKILSQRKNLKAKYGYSDKTIMNTLIFLSKQPGVNKSFASLGLVTPENVEAAFAASQAEKEAAKQMAEGFNKLEITKTVIRTEVLSKPSPKAGFLDPADYL